jgi:hypothetical protein
MTPLKPGDAVEVNPPSPFAIGRGKGVVHRLGTLGVLVWVVFPRQFDGRPVAVFAGDCKLIPAKGGQ